MKKKMVMKELELNDELDNLIIIAIGPTKPSHKIIQLRTILLAKLLKIPIDIDESG